jgi:WD40 repeat protein/tetratricopeptide (TPR) repeat protein
MFWSLILAIVALAGSNVARAAEDSNAAIHSALDLLEDNNAREAVAVLADAARRFPEDRELGELLYIMLRDNRWPMPQTLSLKLPAAISVVKFSPDEKLAIAGADDGTVRVIDVEAGKLLDTTVKHPGAIVGVMILPGDELAFSIDKSGLSRLWKIADGSVVQEGQNRTSSLTTFAVNKDYNLLALGYADGEVHVRDRDGKLVGEPVKHSKAITDLVFSPDGQSLASGSEDGTARIWDVKTSKSRDFVIKHKAPLTSVDADRLGVCLLTTSKDGIARVSRLGKDGKPIVKEVNCGAGILHAQFGASGIYFSTTLTDHTVRIWESETGKPAQGVIRTEDGIVSSDWGPAGISMVTASDGPLANIWRARTGERISEGMLHQSPVRIAAYGPNSRRIATGCADGTVRIWRVDVGAASQVIPTIRTHNGPARTALYSADGKGFVSTSEDLTMVRWDLEKSKAIGRRLPYEGEPMCAVYSPDRSFVVTVTKDGKAFVVDGASGDAKGAPRDLGAPGRWVDFHKDGKHFLTTAGTKAVVWSVEDAAPSGAAIEHPGDGDRELRMARFSPDGSLIVTASADGTARVWDSTSRKEVANLKKHEGAVTSARFSANGKLLVTTGADGLIIVWDTAKWQPTGEPIILPGAAYSAVIGPTGQVVAASSEQSEGIRFFEIASGRVFGKGIDTPSPALSIDLHPSNDRLAVACADSTVRTYGSPFLTQEKIPDWMPEFAERIIGMRVDGPDKFAPVETDYAQMQQYPPSSAPADSDFARLAKWMVTYGIDRTTAPRSTVTIESNIIARVEERSLEALYELFEAQSADPLTFAAMSLYVPTQRQGEFLAEYALARAADNPLAQTYVASTFFKYGRIEEAERLIKTALAAAPNDFRVLRRAGKLDAKLKRKEAAIEKLERAVAADPEDKITYADYGWSLYALDEPAKALEQFKKADDLAGGADPDIGAGICLAAAATGDQTTANLRYRRLIKIAAEWGEADYLRNLTGWSPKQLKEMERIRALVTTTP